MDYDYLVIGSGLAGLNAALLAAEHGRVCLISKAGLADANTRYAQGGIAAAVAADDSAASHRDDTLRAGAGLCDEGAVEVLAREGADAIRRLLALGVPFDRVNGEIALAREGAHSRPRVLHAGGDRTGLHIETVLLERLAESSVDVLAGATIVGLVVDAGVCVGAHLRQADGREETIAARWTVLATGGAGRLYATSTNPAVATGDGIALAFRAGAVLRDLEFMQFHPTALHVPGRDAFLITEAMRGDGARLIAADGHRFMPDYHPDAELAPRDVVARAMAAEMRRTGAGHVWIDISHKDPELVASRFPGVRAHCLECCGLEITREPIPVAPAAHYHMGGVYTDLDGRTSLRGLLACGEVANTGAHGANRVASNSLLEAAVFSRRAIATTRRDKRPAAAADPEDVRDLLLQPDLVAPGPEELQALMWTNAGLERDADGLSQAAATIDSWRGDPRALLAGPTVAARLIVAAALERTESRGAHYRSDFPATAPAWRRHLSYRSRSE